MHPKHVQLFTKQPFLCFHLTKLQMQLHTNEAVEKTKANNNTEVDDGGGFEQPEFLTRFRQKLSAKRDLFTDPEAIEARKFPAACLEDYERVWKDWDVQRQQFNQKLEEQKPKLYKPTPIQRRLLLWSGMYRKPEEMPELVDSYKVSEHTKRMFWTTVLGFVAMYWAIHFVYRCDESESNSF